jgi:hypothetical protein
MSDPVPPTSPTSRPVSIYDVRRIIRLEKRKDLTALFASGSRIAACDYVKQWHWRKRKDPCLFHHQCRRLFKIQRRLHGNS